VRTYQILVFVAACVGAAIFFFRPVKFQTLGFALLLAVLIFLFSILLWFITMRPVDDPDRALVFRLARLDRVDGPGYVFIMPGYDRIAGTIDMGPHLHPIEVPQIRTADSQPIRTNLEVTWRISPNVRGHIPERIRAMVLADEKARQSLVEESVIVMARQIVNTYTAESLGPASAREEASLTIAQAANELLEPSGLFVERIFWRGSSYPAKLSVAKLEGAIRQTEVDTLIESVEKIKKRLPDVPAEELLALAAWLDMYRRGGGVGMPPAPGKGGED
jgi:regulator of protease activity HflC (stomatin/prohibitin superfamily)